jgi:hypothetical protein
MAQKLLTLAAMLDATKRLIFVDASWTKALQALHDLADYSPEPARSTQQVRERLLLVAFGAQSSEVPQDAAVPLVALPQWSERERLLPVLVQED